MTEGDGYDGLVGDLDDAEVRITTAELEVEVSSMNAVPELVGWTVIVSICVTVTTSTSILVTRRSRPWAR
jgi:hypothetical protein